MQSPAMMSKVKLQELSSDYHQLLQVSTMFSVTSYLGILGNLENFMKGKE